MLHLHIKFIYSLLLISCIVILYGCKNKYERQVVGNYILSNDTSNIKVSKKLQLKLMDNMEFDLSGSNLKIAGKWEAGDDGDMTWLNLIFKNIISQCHIVGQQDEYIIIENPTDIDSTLVNTNEIEFIRTNNN